MMMERRRNGVAIVLVLVVLSVLLLLGTPFIASMVLRKHQAGRTNAIAKLRNASTSLRNDAAAHVVATHEDNEARVFDADHPPEDRLVPGPVNVAMQHQGRSRTMRGRSNRSNRSNRQRQQGGVVDIRPQDVDGMDEVSPGSLQFSDEYERGLRILGNGQVTDEQGKVDVNRASFLLLGNLFGSDHLNKAMDERARQMELTDASMFPSDGDPQTMDGLLVIHNAWTGAFEAVTYRHKQGNVLHGVVRGELLSIPAPHSQGSLVMDARALKLFLHRLWGSKPNTFASLSGLRCINNWSLMRFFADQLWHYNLPRKAIPSLPELARLLGVHDDRVDTQALKEAEKKLMEAGLPASIIDEAEDVLGEKAIIEFAESLTPDNAREMVEELKRELKRDWRDVRDHANELRNRVDQLKALLTADGMEALTAGDLARFRDLLTVHAEPVVGWTPETQAQGKLRFGRLVVSADNPGYLGAGSYVRLMAGGTGKAELNLVSGKKPVASGAYSGSAVGVTFERPVSSGISRAANNRKLLASAAMRSPVNINTAPYSVLVAAMKGVRLQPRAQVITGEASRTGVRQKKVKSSIPITGRQARQLADRIYGSRPIPHPGRLAQIFFSAAESGLIDRNQSIALRINSVNPHSEQLLLSTCAFTYTAGNYFGFSFQGVARRGNYREMARFTSYDVLKTAPPRLLNMIWDTQAGFSYRGSLSGDPRSGGFLRALPGRSGNLVVTYGDELNQDSMSIGSGQAQGQGGRGITQHIGYPRHVPAVLTSATARLTPHRGRTRGRVESFTNRLEGELLAGGRSLSYSMGGDLPFAVDFYMCPLWSGGSGEVPLAAINWGDQNQPGSIITFSLDLGLNELILRLNPGRVEPDPMEWGNSDDIFVGARYRLNQQLAPDTWYHVGFVVGSVEPGGQCILFDGRAVGHGNLCSPLQGNLTGSAGGGSLSLRDENVVDRLPQRGPFWVGDEIVYAQGKTGSGLSLGPLTAKDDAESGRGCRGSPVLSHSGALVRPLGYNVELTKALQSQITGSDPMRSFQVQVAQDNPIVVGRAGAVLASNLAVSMRVVGGMPENAMQMVSSGGTDTGTGGGGGPGGGDGGGMPFNQQDHRIEQELLQNMGQNPQPVNYTYPLIIVVSTYGPKPAVDQGTGGPGGGDGGGGPGGGVPGGTPGQGSGAFYPIGEEYDYIPVPVDPRQAGFGDSGILRIRYRFGSQTIVNLGGQNTQLSGDGERNGGYDRIVEYSSIGQAEVPGDKQYPAFLGVRDISQVVFRQHRQRPLQDFLTDTRPLRQMRIYGISIPTGNSNLAGSYPNRGVIQLQSSGQSNALYEQLRDVEWIAYTHIYQNYFISPVEFSTCEDRWNSDPTQEARNSNNKILRGFCGAVTPPGSGNQWAENFDPQGIANHSAGTQLACVFAARSAFPGAGDGVYLSQASNLNQMELKRVHKKAETDYGVLMSFYNPAQRNYVTTTVNNRSDGPVIRRFPEPYRLGVSDRQGGGSARITIGPSRYHRAAGALNAIVDEVRYSSGTGLWQGVQYHRFGGTETHRGFVPFVLRAGRGSTGQASRLTQGKNGETLSFVTLPLPYNGIPFQIQNPGKFECLYSMGNEMVHLQVTEGEGVQRVQVRVPAGMGRHESDTRFSSLTGAGAGGGNNAAGGNNLMGGAGQIPPPVFLKPAMMREPYSRIQLTGSVSSNWANGGYLVFPHGRGGREIWSFESASGNTLVNCRRGVLGSVVACTEYWAEPQTAYVLPYYRVKVVRGGILDSDAQAQEMCHNLGTFAPNFPVADGQVTTRALVGDLWRPGDARGGYVRIDDGRPESLDRIVAYKFGGSGSGGGLQLFRDPIQETPLYYGSFGTQQARTSRGTLVDLPTRYFDRYVLGQYSRDLQHFTRGVRQPGALWRRLSWEHGQWIQGAERRVGPKPQIRVLLRFNGAPAWHAKPVAVKTTSEGTKVTTGKLYVFSDPVPARGFPLNVFADEVELRFLFYWPPQSYGRMGGRFVDTWKVAPRLRSVRLEYQDRSGVVHHEEVVE